MQSTWSFATLRTPQAGRWRGTVRPRSRVLPLSGGSAGTRARANIFPVVGMFAAEGWLYEVMEHDTDADTTTLDLTGEHPVVRSERDHILHYLRNSGGSLNDRLMKHAAADLIEGIA